MTGAYSVQPARSGRPALVRPDGSWAESRFHPEKDASRRVADAKLEPGDKVLLLGMGAGELPRAILGACGPDGRLVIAEPEGRAIDAVMASGHGEYLSDERVEVITSNVVVGVSGTTRAWKICRTAQEFYRALAALDSDLKCLAHPGLTPPPGYEALVSVIEDFEIRRRSSFRFADDFERNIQLNRESFAAALPVSRLRGILAGEDVIVAGGGPSLESISRAVGADANWIAVGTALLPLRARGIIPHLAVITDPQPSVGIQLSTLDPDDRPPVVVFPSTAHEVILAARRLIAAHPEAGWPGTGMPGRGANHENALPAGGTVATTAIGLAVLAGARRIYLAGVDLAEVPERTHTRGTASEQMMVETMGRFGTIEASLQRCRGEFIEAVSVTGTPIRTRRNLQLYARAIEGLATRHSSVEFLQLSPMALPLRGIPFVDVSNRNLSKISKFLLPEPT
ncbi:MAG: 6-hydroxymethylpterin diphosphokinase MptE-like protein [Candidatus Hydrogenedentota bacterium]